MNYALRSIFLTAWLTCGVSSGWAQSSLHDPMRPPSATSFAAQLPTSDAANPAGEKIQMLIIGRQRAFAMIDGLLVKPGESVNQWQLVSIGHQSVVMRNASVTQEISINPSVVKTIRRPSQQISSNDSVDNKTSRNRP